MSDATARAASVTRVGVIGVGVMGEIHATNVARTAGATLVAVCDPDAARAERVAASAGAEVIDEGESLIARSDVDAVVVASSDDTHVRYVLACLRAGKPVLCEKPLSLTVDDSRTIVDAEAATGRRLVQLGFMREYDPAHVAVREVVRSGRLGRTVLFRGTHVNPDTAPFRMTAEEAIVKSMIHDIHSTRFLTGCEFVDVHARAVAADDDARYTRYVVVSAQLDGGALALLDVNMEANYGYVVSAEVTGTNGSVATAAPSSAVVSCDGQRVTGLTMHWSERFSDAYRRECAAWVASVAAGRPEGPTSRDGYVAQCVAEACCRSLRSGAAVTVRPL